MPDLTDTQVAQMLNVLAERTRATTRLVPTFQPPHPGIIEEASARQHQLIVGRRGVGKSMLLLSVTSRLRERGQLVVYLDIETYRGTPYPDVLIRILVELALAMVTFLRKEHPVTTWNLRRRIRRLIRILNRHLPSPQQTGTRMVTESNSETESTGSASVGGGVSKGTTGFNIRLGTTRGKRRRTIIVDTAEFSRTKMDVLRDHVPDFRKVLGEAADNLETLIILDDFYFIPKQNQPDVLSYLHQLVKNQGIWMKIGGVEHRLQPFVEGDPPMGLQPYHDAGLIRLDATLRDFQNTKRFLESILRQASNEAGIDFEDLLTETARERLVLASGGVPRDYLNLVAAALRRATTRQGTENRPRNRINAEDVTEVAPEFLAQKEQELALDANPEDVQRLRDRFNDVVNFCTRTNRHNVFVVEATKLQEEQWGRDLAALAELRFLHRIGNLTVKSSSPRYVGRRYEAFVLDSSAYAASRVRNIEMIEFWTPDGFQRIRGARFIYEPSDHRDADTPEALDDDDAEQLEFVLSDLDADS